MDDLTYTLRQLCQRNRDGSHNTQADRMRSLRWPRGNYVRPVSDR